MNFIFYDLETTGRNICWDQILQIGAILTNEKFACFSVSYGGGEKPEKQGKVNSGCYRKMCITVTLKRPKALPRAFRRVTGSLFARLDGDQLHIKHQNGIRRNHRARAARAVRQLGGHSDGPLVTDVHQLQHFYPARDNAGNR